MTYIDSKKFVGFQCLYILFLSLTMALYTFAAVGYLFLDIRNWGEVPFHHMMVIFLTYATPGVFLLAFPCCLGLLFSENNKPIAWMVALTAAALFYGLICSMFFQSKAFVIFSFSIAGIVSSVYAWLLICVLPQKISKTIIVSSIFLLIFFIVPIKNILKFYFHL